MSKKSIKDNRSVKVKTPRSQLEIDQQMLQAPSAHQVDSLDDPRKKLPELGPKPRKQNPAGLPWGRGRVSNAYGR